MILPGSAGRSSNSNENPLLINSPENPLIGGKRQGFNYTVPPPNFHIPPPNILKVTPPPTVPRPQSSSSHASLVSPRPSERSFEREERFSGSIDEQKERKPGNELLRSPERVLVGGKDPQFNQFEGTDEVDTETKRRKPFDPLPVHNGHDFRASSEDSRAEIR